MHQIEIPDSSDAKSMRSKSEAQDVVRAISHWYERLQKYPESDKVRLLAFLRGLNFFRFSKTGEFG